MKINFSITQHLQKEYNFILDNHLLVKTLSQYLTKFGNNKSRKKVKNNRARHSLGAKDNECLFFMSVVYCETGLASTMRGVPAQQTKTANTCAAKRHCRKKGRSRRKLAIICAAKDHCWKRRHIGGRRPDTPSPPLPNRSRAEYQPPRCWMLPTIMIKC